VCVNNSFCTDVMSGVDNRASSVFSSAYKMCICICMSTPSSHSRRFYLKLHIQYNNIYSPLCNFLFYLLFILLRLFLYSLVGIAFIVKCSRPFCRGRYTKFGCNCNCMVMFHLFGFSLLAPFFKISLIQKF